MKCMQITCTRRTYRQVKALLEVVYRRGSKRIDGSAPSMVVMKAKIFFIYTYVRI